MKRIILFILFTSAIQIVYGQVETRYYPEGDAFEQEKCISEHPNSDRTIEFPAFDIQKLIEEDELINELDVPFRFGKGFDTEITLADGEWTKVENGRLWSMGFLSEGAYSINFVFDGFYLSDSAKLYVVNSDGTMLYGPVTSKQNTKNGYFLTDLVQGDDVIVYLFEPDSEKGKSRLTIKRVVHAYKNLFSNMAYGNLGGSDTCNNNIACFPAWDLESDAVALVLLSDGTEWCSGSLLMTADQTFEPYFLSAFHCIDIGIPSIYLDNDEGDGVLEAYEKNNAQNWMFKFQYKMASCGGSTATTGVTFNGAEFKAAWYTTDFALMELDVSPLGDSRISRLGWDKSGNIPTSGTGIHHPSGDVMKISFDENQLSETSRLSNSGTYYWKVDWDDGVTETGSSGSPLFDQNKRVIGQLSGGYSGCSSNDMRDWYGCFDLSWTGGGTDITRLSTWLDPDNIGTDTINTKRNPTISGSSILCSSGEEYQIYYVPEDATITWSTSSGIARTSEQGSNPCTFIATNSGTTGWIGATVTYEGITITLTPKSSIWLGGVPSPEVYANNATLTGPDWYTVALNASNVYFYLVPDPAGSLIYPDTWDVEGDSYWYTNGSFLEFFPNTVGENIVAGYRQNACGYNGTYFTVEVVASKSSEGGEEISFKLSPNPANEYVDIKLELPDEEKMVDSYRVDFIDSYSRNVKQVILSEMENRVNIQDLPSGYYVVMLRCNGEVYSNKLIVE